MLPTENSDHNGAVAFPDGHLALVGTEAAVVAALNARAAGGTSFNAASGLARDLGRIDPRATAWAIVDVARAHGLPVRSQDAAARTRARSAGLRTTDHSFVEAGPDAYWSLARTLAALRALPSGVSEFMVHPGRFDDDLGYSR